MKEPLMRSSESIMEEIRVRMDKVDGVDRAVELLNEVVARTDGPTWGEAKLRLATIVSWVADYECSAQLANEVVTGPRDLVSDAVRAVAAISMAVSHWELGRDCDLVLLERSVRTALAANELEYGALGLRILGDFLEQQGDKTAARRAFEESASIDEQHGWVCAAATTLRRLACLEHEAGESQHAIELLEHSVTLLHRHPLKQFDPVFLRLDEQESRTLIDKIRRAEPS
ncbi:MAG: tetratricopeptide repeat protein [Kofleriaceae bacterium]